MKTSDSTVTIRVSGRPDTEVHKADLETFGTAEQRNTPLEQFIQPEDKNRNATVAMVERMQKHVSTSLKKFSGEMSIRKQSDIDPSCDPSKSNIKKVSPIENPERKASKTIKRRSWRSNSSKFQPIDLYELRVQILEFAHTIQRPHYGSAEKNFQSAKANGSAKQ